MLGINMSQNVNFEKWNEEMSRKYDHSIWYDQPLTRLINAKKRLKVTARLAKKGTIIDVGCGAGQQINLIKKKYPDSRCCGLDLSKFSLNNAIKNYGKSIQWIQGNAEKIDGFDNFFDVVLCSEILEHVENPNKVIDEILRISKSNAQIIISIPNMSYVDNVKDFLRIFGLHKLFPKSFSSDEWHIRDMNMEIFKSLVKNKLIIRKRVPIPNKLLPLWYVIELKKFP